MPAAPLRRGCFSCEEEFQFFFAGSYELQGEFKAGIAVQDFQIGVVFVFSYLALQRRVVHD